MNADQTWNEAIKAAERIRSERDIIDTIKSDPRGTMNYIFTLLNMIAVRNDAIAQLEQKVAKLENAK